MGKLSAESDSRIIYDPLDPNGEYDGGYKDDDDEVVEIEEETNAVVSLDKDGEKYFSVTQEGPEKPDSILPEHQKKPSFFSTKYWCYTKMLVGALLFIAGLVCFSWFPLLGIAGVAFGAKTADSGIKQSRKIPSPRMTHEKEREEDNDFQSSHASITSKQRSVSGKWSLASTSRGSDYSDPSLDEIERNAQVEALSDAPSTTESESSRLCISPSRSRSP